MDNRKIGSLEVSVVGLGTNNFGLGMDEDAVGPVVDAAMEAGVNFFDTADSYGKSEERLGRALGRRREDVVVATKFGSPVGKDRPAGAAPDYVREAAERSLRELGTDRIDLYQLHKPDPSTPIADTLAALDELVRAGKVLEIGCSNFSAAQLREAEAAVADGAVRFVSVQNHYNLLNRDDETDAIAECERSGVAYLPYFPLASGLLTGKYTRGEAPPEGTRLDRWGPRAGGVLTDANFDVVDALSAWAEARGHGILDLAVAWLAAKPFVASVIAGATKPEQVVANVAAAGWRLSPEEVSEVDALAAVPAAGAN
ncbi:MAG TPA: aldo/keto reductase [Acidimicrobiales bacterium]|nr:aldo/keto reductase [Acidimicrobiales bacterium]